MCVIYMNRGSNGGFVIGTALTGGHYRSYIISSVSHQKLDSIGLLVLWTITYNIQGTGVVLQVPRDSTNPAEKSNISCRPYMIIMTYRPLVYLY